ncbi:Ni-sirohydrochlorin a,c-diamide synthase [Methanofollis fontis]|uniref:Cobyrinate a,c-diamide synthase n=1 Tax=Methanofollis fontis TaxID=2052832 RepID=A0A483CSZ6_9EURY|nr:Ni-sirohydrochlorin a,c-diamide synthase [Methanofollis fontis]TAJ44443.1 Ni-sirohydrochlorin a,c-diamide synthase [Methanofollis fontis]
MKALLITGDRSGSGKTSITLAIAALLAQEAPVQTYKVAMDYIDPSYLSAVTGRPCRNLDSYVMGPDEIRAVFEHGASGAEIGLVEGVRGLYEGAEAIGDAGSTASIAKALDLPVVLVVDARSITRSAAALVKGFAAFDPDVQIAGVILNNLSGAGHRQKTLRAVEHYCDLPVIGAIPKSEEMRLAMRHLGLVPYREGQESGDFLERVAAVKEVIGTYVDLDALRGLMADYTFTGATGPFLPPQESDLRVAVAYDEAFNFYYNDLFDILQGGGAAVVPWSPVHDPLPEADGYIIGGGYPEMHAASLEANDRAREALREEVMNGTPVYAECGGLIYLTKRQNLSAGWEGREQDESFEMCGVFDGETFMPVRRTLGYVEGRAGSASPFGEGTFRGHEFHYSDVRLAAGTRYAYELSRGTGIEGSRDGAVVSNTLASYTHLHPVPAAPFFHEFLNRCRAARRT